MSDFGERVGRVLFIAAVTIVVGFGIGLILGIVFA